MFIESIVQALSPVPQNLKLPGSVPVNSAPQNIELISPIMERPSSSSEFESIHINNNNRVYSSSHHTLPDRNPLVTLVVE